MEKPCVYKTYLIVELLIQRVSTKASGVLVNV